MYPYPKETEVMIVVCKGSSFTMASASHERTKTHYLVDNQVPIIWYFCQSTVVGQGEVVRKALLKHTAENRQVKSARILWIPSSGIASQMNIRRDILEVSDCIQKCK